MRMLNPPLILLNLFGLFSLVITGEAQLDLVENTLSDNGLASIEDQKGGSKFAQAHESFYVVPHASHPSTLNESHSINVVDIEENTELQQEFLSLNVSMSIIEGEMQISSSSWEDRDQTSMSPRLLWTCISNCDDCTSGEWVCDICSAGFFYDTVFFECVATCLAGTYPDPITRNCEYCYPDCDSCDGPNPNNCFSCYWPFINDPVRKTCECQAHHYLLDPDCLPCLEGCDFCEEDISCIYCKAGYYSNSFVLGCLSCPEECETCDENGDCLTCSSSLNRVSNGVGTCGCLPSFFERSQSLTYDSTLTRANSGSSTFGECLACSGGCLNCSNENTCIQCLDTVNYKLINSECIYIPPTPTPTPTPTQTNSTNSENQSIIALNQGAYAVAGGSAVIALPSLLLGNPALFLSCLDIIQIIKYILYVDVKYPEIIVAFFQLFDSTDGSQLPKIVDFDLFKQRSSQGFYSHQVDSLFLQNSSQNVVVFSFLGLLYYMIKRGQRIIANNTILIKQEKPNAAKMMKRRASISAARIFNPRTSILVSSEITKVRLARTMSRHFGKNIDMAEQQEIDKLCEIKSKKSQKLSIIFSKLIHHFEWSVFLGGVEAAFLNLCTFCFLQLQNASIQSYPQLISFTFGFIVFSFLVAFIVKIYQVMVKIISFSKTVTLVSSESNEVNTIIPLQSVMSAQDKEEMESDLIFLHSFEIIHSLYMPGPLLKQGFFLVVIVRKFLFAFILVFAYKQPIVILSVWIVLNCTMIFILIKYRPYKVFLYNVRDILTELFFAAVHGLTIPLTWNTYVEGSSTDTNNPSDDETQFYTISIWVFTSICAIIFIQIITLLCDSIESVKHYLKKEEAIPPTPIVPGTPCLSRAAETITLDLDSNVEYEKVKLHLLKNAMFSAFEETHENNINNAQFSSDIKSGITSIFEQMKNSNSTDEYNKLKNDYESTIYLAEVAVSLEAYLKKIPETVEISFEKQKNFRSGENKDSQNITFKSEDAISINSGAQAHSLKIENLDLPVRTSPFQCPTQQSQGQKQVAQINLDPTIDTTTTKLESQSQMQVSQTSHQLIMQTPIRKSNPKLSIGVSNVNSPSNLQIALESNRYFQSVEQIDESPLEINQEAPNRKSNDYKDRRISLFKKRQQKLKDYDEKDKLPL